MSSIISLAQRLVMTCSFAEGERGGTLIMALQEARGRPIAGLAVKEEERAEEMGGRDRPDGREGCRLEGRSGDSRTPTAKRF